MIQLNISKLASNITAFVIALLGFSKNVQPFLIETKIILNTTINPVAIMLATKGLKRRISSTGEINQVYKAFKDNYDYRTKLAIFHPLLEFFYYYDRNADASTYTLTRSQIEAYFVDRPGRRYPLYMHHIFNMLLSSGSVKMAGYTISVTTNIALLKSDVQSMLKDNFLGDNIVGQWKASGFSEFGPSADLSIMSNLIDGFTLLPFTFPREFTELYSLANCFLSPDAKGADTFVYTLRNTFIDDTDRAMALAFTLRGSIFGIPDITDAFSELYQKSVIIGKDFIYNGGPITQPVDDFILNESRGYVSYHIVSYLSEILFGVGETSPMPVSNPKAPLSGNKSRKGQSSNLLSQAGEITRLSSYTPNKPEGSIQRSSLQTLKPQTERGTLGRKGAPDVTPFPINDPSMFEFQAEFEGLRENEALLSATTNNVVGGLKRIGNMLNTAVNLSTSGQTANLVNVLKGALSIYRGINNNARIVQNSVTNVQHNTLQLQASIDQRLGINLS